MYGGTGAKEKGNRLYPSCVEVLHLCDERPSVAA
jgi:hypothetical protein